MAGIQNRLIGAIAIGLCSCSGSTSGLLPDAELHHLEDYHCWPYSVSIYSFDGALEKAALHGYPLDSYFPANGKYEVTRWSVYSEKDTSIWGGADSTLKDCTGNAELYASVLRGDRLYYAGQYMNMITAGGGSKRHYERLIFLDPKSKRLHVFKDVNKVF